MFGVSCDVRDAGSVNAAFDEGEAEFGPVEALVANAGIIDDGPFPQLTEAQFGRVLNTNLTGSLSQVTYAASKAGLVGVARSLTRELAGRNITANVVAPGPVETEQFAAIPDERRAEFHRAIPAGRFAQPDDVAGVFTWLAGDTASYVSGAIIPVDGGLSMGHQRLAPLPAPPPPPCAAARNDTDFPLLRLLPLGRDVVTPGYTDPRQFVAGNPYGASHTSDNADAPGPHRARHGRVTAARQEPTRFVPDIAGPRRPFTSRPHTINGTSSGGASRNRIPPLFRGD